MVDQLCLVLLFSFGTVAGQTYVDSYHLMAPSKPGGTTLQSRVYSIDVVGGKAMLIQSLGGISSAYSVSNTRVSSADVSYSAFDMSLETHTAALRVQLRSDVTSATDSYFPLPASCLGMNYIVSTWSPGATGTAFIAVGNTDVSTVLDISLHANLLGTQLTFSDTTLNPGGSAQITLAQNEVLYLTSTSHALDGVYLSASNNVSVYAGNWDTKVLGIGLANSVVEMISPISFFSTEYVVCMPDGISYSFVKIIVLNANTVVTVTTGPGPVTSNTLSFMGDTWTYAHSTPILVSATLPVLVMQYVPETDEWASSYLLYPLHPQNDGVHQASIVVRTGEISTFVATRVEDNVDITSALVFNVIQTAPYSVANLVLNDSSVFQLYSDTNATFQVIQYGGIGSSNGAYSLPVGMLLSCRQSATVGQNTSISSSSNSGKSGTYFMLPDRTVYIIVACLAAAIVLFLTVAILIGYRINRTHTKPSPLFGKFSPAHVAVVGSQITKDLPSDTGKHAYSSSYLITSSTLPASSPPDCRFVWVKPIGPSPSVNH